MQRVPGLQDDAAARRRHTDRTATRRTAGRKVHTLRESPDQEARAIWNIYRLLGLSEVQVHPADHDGHQVPEVQRRRICEAWQHGQRWARTPTRFLRLLALPGLRFHDAVHAHAGTVPEVRRSVHRREEIQDRRRPHLPQRRLRLGAARPRTAIRPPFLRQWKNQRPLARNLKPSAETLTSNQLGIRK